MAALANWIGASMLSVVLAASLWHVKTKGWKEHNYETALTSFESLY
jgi:hypothetical protein